MLTFTTDPLEHDVEVTGPIALVLYASSDQTDTEFFVKVSEQQGVPKLKELVMEHVAKNVPPHRGLAHLLRLQEGNRIRLELSNGDSMVSDGLFHHYYGHKAGCDRIHHDAEHPSHLILPVIPES